MLSSSLDWLSSQPRLGGRLTTPPNKTEAPELSSYYDAYASPPGENPHSPELSAARPRWQREPQAPAQREPQAQQPDGVLDALRGAYALTGDRTHGGPRASNVGAEPRWPGVDVAPKESRARRFPTNLRRGRASPSSSSKYTVAPPEEEIQRSRDPLPQQQPVLSHAGQGVLCWSPPASNTISNGRRKGTTRHSPSGKAKAVSLSPLALSPLEMDDVYMQAQQKLKIQRQTIMDLQQQNARLTAALNSQPDTDTALCDEHVHEFERERVDDEYGAGAAGGTGLREADDVLNISGSRSVVTMTTAGPRPAAAMPELPPCDQAAPAQAQGGEQPRPQLDYQQDHQQLERKERPLPLLQREATQDDIYLSKADQRAERGGGGGMAMHALQKSNGLGNKARRKGTRGYQVRPCIN